MLKFTVMGDPIKHSLSPLIHAEFAQQAGIELEYTRTHVPAEKFAVAVD
jgi:shikimate dehydrogenase